MPYKNKEDANKWRLARKETKKLYDKQHNKKAAVRAKVKKNKQNRLQLLRQHIIDYLHSHPCVDCGETDIVVLEFDHIANKTIGISKAVSAGWSINKLKTEISKCEVRCANDHRRKTSTDFKWYKYRRLVK